MTGLKCCVFRSFVFLIFFVLLIIICFKIHWVNMRHRHISLPRREEKLLVFFWAL